MPRSVSFKGALLGLSLALYLVPSWGVLLAGCPGCRADDSPIKAEKKEWEEQLRNLDETASRIRRASGELHREVNRYETITVGPDLYDYDVMDPWFSAYPGLYPTGMASGFQNQVRGPILPPRKRYVDLSMSQLQQLIPLLSQDLTNLDGAIKALATQTGDEINAQLLAAGDAATKLSAFYGKLVPLTTGSTYNNKAISEQTEDIRDEVDAVRQIRKRVAKMIGRMQ